MLEAMMASSDGLTRGEINTVLQSHGFAPLGRKRFFSEIKYMRDTTHLNIRSLSCGKNVWRYNVCMDSEEDCRKADFVLLLIANLMESDFLSEFRQLGNRIQPLLIPRGNQYLHRIGLAMLESRCLEIVYGKFVDSEPYTCIVHPYTLKAYQGRWYLLARKSDESSLKHFALDRIHSLDVMQDTFLPDSGFDSTAYYRHYFGIWCDRTLVPQYVLVTTTPNQAHYFRTLPLHHSQKELAPIVLPDGQQRCRFLLHICITPDFEMEMKKYCGLARWEVMIEGEEKENDRNK